MQSRIIKDDESKQFGPIMPKLEQIINSYAVANQISFVVDTSANPNNLIYADKSLNIIAPVVMAYEKASGTPAPAAPASAAPRPPAAKTTHPPAPWPKNTAPAKKPRPNKDIEMNMKLKFLLAPALVLISGAGLWGQAAAPPPATKLALINMQDAMGATKEGQARINALREKYSPKQQEFQKRGADIQAKQDQLKKTQNTLSEEAVASAKAEITRLQTALQRDTDDATTDSDADSQKMMQDIGPKLVNAVTKYSQDNQIMIVFDISSQPNRNLVCCASAPDITRGNVIALYDRDEPGWWRLRAARHGSDGQTGRRRPHPDLPLRRTVPRSPRPRAPPVRLFSITKKGRSACFAPFSARGVRFRPGARATT